MAKIAYGGNARLTPVANEYYAFSGWVYNGTPIEEGTHSDLIDGVKTVELGSDGVLVLREVTKEVKATELVAKFDRGQVDVNASADPQDGGTVDIQSFTE